MSEIRDSVLSLINECVEVLNQECNEWKYKFYGAKNPNKCRNKLVHMLEPCTKVYQLIYRSLCEKRVEYYMKFAQIRSIVGHIMSTPGFSINEILRRINEVLKEHQCKAINSA